MTNISSLKSALRRLTALWQYVSEDVWADTRRNWWINIIKTINLSVRSFLNADLQSQACAITYRTMLAIVPALALIFAIGRGFGMGALLQDQLMRIFPAQHEAITAALGFVDSYLKQSSEGIFVGVGILFLLWTLISLIGSIETSFNGIWKINQGRSLIRKISDYTAMMLILPVLMICAGGLLIMLNKSLCSALGLTTFTPVIKFLFELLSMALTWLFFAMMYLLIPNTKVRFRYALLSGALTGTGYFILQWLFVTSQMYVARYNAIYGSFSFLPLFLIWMQLVWVVCLSGCVLCYASQNIFRFSFANQIRDISREYLLKIILAVAAVICRAFVDNKPPVTAQRLMDYGIPSQLVMMSIDSLRRAGVISQVVVDEKRGVIGYQPAVSPDTLTVAEVSTRLNNLGLSDFIPDFDKNFKDVVKLVRDLDSQAARAGEHITLSSLSIHPLK